MCIDLVADFPVEENLSNFYLGGFNYKHQQDHEDFILFT